MDRAMVLRALLPGVVAAALLGAAAGPAGAAATDWVGDAHAAVRLITAADAVGTGPAVEAGLEFRFSPGWHGYWRTPGDAGLPPVIDWSGSGNVVSGDVAWPAPVRLVVEGLQNSVYEKHVILPVTLKVETPGKPASLRAMVGYAACSNICVPFQAELTLPLLSGTGGPSVEAPLIEAARAAVPGTPAAAGIQVGATRLAKSGAATMLTVDLTSEAEPFHHPDLFVEGAGSGLPPAPTIDLQEGRRFARLSVSLPYTEQSERPLTLTVVDGPRAAAFSGPSPVAGPVPGDAPRSTLLVALMSALLGGLILNLMPCVLPVLSIKLLGLIRHAGAGRRAMRLSLVATALGIMTSFGLLAAALIGLKWSGASLGWGIQFQQPWFLASMATLTVLFAASFFDWLSIGLPSGVMTAAGAGSPHPLLGAFLTGVFATLLATPCSAPFVGTAVGFALAQGSAEIVAIFLCLGIGMALPYWAAVVFPGLVGWLPRPGPWMLVLRTVLGVLLLGTAAWLLVVLWSTAGSGIAALIAIILIALLALRAWTSRRSPAGRPWPTIATAVLALAPLTVSALPASALLPPSQDSDWQAFEPALLPGLVAAGKTVLVDVTATWCLTCKVNEVAALDRPPVVARLGRADVVRMRADWSRPNPMIASYLHRFARYGIPLDVVYGPARPAGEALPELLTPSLVVDALDRASGSAPSMEASTP